MKAIEGKGTMEPYYGKYGPIDPKVLKSARLMSVTRMKKQKIYELENLPSQIRDLEVEEKKLTEELQDDR